MSESTCPRVSSETLRLPASGPRGSLYSCVLRSVAEDFPGEHWRQSLDRFWPSYQRWFLHHGDAARPSLTQAVGALRHHLPELESTYDRLTALADHDPGVARFLPLYNPTPYLTGCSQVVWNQDGHPLLVRNYDYAPHLWEAQLLRSNWRGTGVLAMSDCLWGALDGVNSRGLAAALSFGGRRVVGNGFGISLVVRYLLEVCSTVREAVTALARIPSRMAYNVSLVDASGDYATAHLAPDQPPFFSPSLIATNHQAIRDWGAHTAATRSLEREHFLSSKLTDPLVNAATLVDSFLQPPLYSHQYRRGFGTLYTAVYDPREGSVALRWPDHHLVQRLDHFEPGETLLHFQEAGQPATSLGAPV